MSPASHRQRTDAARVDDVMATFAIGDVHGCIATLDELLERLAPTPEDELIFIGDYVDRGPNSRAVIQRLLEMEEAAESGTGPRCIFLRGNHDQMMLDYIDYPGDHDVYELWTINGGLSTLNSYVEDGGLAVPDEHIEFLRRAMLVHETDDFVYVHAGLDPKKTISENLAPLDPLIALWTRGHLKAKLNKWEKTVVCGHTPQRDPTNEPRLINIDTGAVYDHIPGLGKLTAVRLPEREFTQVDYCG